jgi:hypothetical protein
MPSRRTLQQALEKEKELLELENRLSDDTYWEECDNKPNQMLRVNEMKNLLEIDENLNSTMKRPTSRMGRRGRPTIRELETAFINLPKVTTDKHNEHQQHERESLFNKTTNRSSMKLFIDVNNDEVFEDNSIYDVNNIDDALNIFEDDLPDIKVIYKDFYKRNLPIVKEELPGLRLHQYQDKIKKMWEISFENPKNNR